MNELIMRALSYVDDRWITEAMSDYETVKMKHFFQKERRKKYLCTAYQKATSKHNFTGHGNY